MQKIDSQIVEQLKEAFYQFRQNPYHRFVVKVRQYRAEQMRMFFAENPKMDWDTFHSEVWDPESKSIWSSAGIDIGVFPETKKCIFVEKLILDGPRILSRVVTWNELEDALKRGDLELHGQYIWRQGGGIFYPHAVNKSEEYKLELIHRAILILSDNNLSSLQKVRALRRVGGFGECNATGLVMVTNPKGFSIINKVTRGAFRLFGVVLGSESRLADNQEVLFSLKEALGATDFLELDWFLFLFTKEELSLVEPR